jgi:excisionase family DNA binding protein
MFDNGYITLETLATRLSLPQKFLKQLAHNNEIPFLNVNGRLRFCEADVKVALSSLAQQSSIGGNDNE